MKQILKSEITKLKNKSQVDQRIYQRFLERLENGQGLLRADNINDHYCVFFLPFHQLSHSVYLGHHIKANDWIPPGGHIEPNETPIETIKREFLEELDYELKDERVELFDLTIKNITNPNHKCRVHWDIWYLVHIRKIKFHFDKREFYDAAWFKLKKAIPKIKGSSYRQTVEKLLHNF